MLRGITLKTLKEPLVLTLVFWVFVISMLSAPVWLSTEVVALTSVETANIPRMLAILLFISLLLERTLEVFVTSWRRTGADLIDSELQRLGKEKSDLEAVAEELRDKVRLSEVAEALMQETSRRIAYRSNTQRIAMWMGLGFGIVISTVGIRTLATLVDPVAIENVPTLQKVAFRVTDVALTGGLLAGGSEGIHKVTQVFTTFMETTAKRARGGDS
jgi:hypothetical protein